MKSIIFPLLIGIICIASAFAKPIEFGINADLQYFGETIKIFDSRVFLANDGDDDFNIEETENSPTNISIECVNTRKTIVEAKETTEEAIASLKTACERKHISDELLFFHPFHFI